MSIIPIRSSETLREFLIYPLYSSMCSLVQKIKSFAKEFFTSIKNYVSRFDLFSCFIVNKKTPIIEKKLSLNGVNIEDFSHHTWSSSGGSALTFFPFSSEYKICDTNIKMFFDYEKQLLRFEIPQTPFRFALECSGHLIYSSNSEDVSFTFTPKHKNLDLKYYKFNESVSPCKWEPGLTRSLLVCLKEEHAISPLSKELQTLLDQQPQVSGESIAKEAIDWIDHGSYLLEDKGLYGSKPGLDSFQMLQHLKCLALAAAGETVEQSLIDISKAAIVSKGFQMNCWQLCLLCYVIKGLIPWEIIGRIYKIIDQDSAKRIPDALKFQNYTVIDFTNKESTPSPGDILFFSRQSGIDWHCGIFLEKKEEESKFEIIEILGTKVKKSTSTLKHELVTFVKSRDVLGNLLNYLSFYESHKAANKSPPSFSRPLKPN